MVTDETSQVRKIIHPDGESFFQILKGCNRNSRNLRKGMNVIRKIGFPDGDGAIRTPCRQNLDGEALIFCKLHMVF